ncbi:MAG: hypothetical protein JSR50_11610 [Proteobacteria bacterium]|nr:hypothetical protein [Pseudomonadota bacterium]
MPRRRTIACDHCGYLQLKRDTECDHCGRLTRRERNRWIAKGIELAIIAVVGIYGYFKIKGLVPH